MKEAHFRLSAELLSMIAAQQKRRKDNLIVRARIIQSIRNFFIDNDYTEIETPIRIPAPALEAHIDAVESGDWFLQTSPELCMKMLLARKRPFAPAGNDHAGMVPYKQRLS